MSQELTKISPAPAALMVSEQEAAAVREAFAVNIASGSITEFDLPRIRPMNGEALWKIPTLEGHQTAPSIEGVVAFARDTRAYYPGKDITNQPPDCSSMDGITGTPRAGVNKAREDAGQSAIGGECKACPMAQWESAAGDSNAQACKQSKQLFFLRGPSLFLEVVSLPPTSLKAVRQFFLKLVTQGVQYHQCILRIDLKEATNAQHQKYGTAVLGFVRKLSADEMARAMEYRAVAESIAERVDISPVNG